MFHKFIVIVCFLLFSSQMSYAQRTLPNDGDGFTANELVDRGHNFFGKVARGFAEGVESAVSKYGRPNGYILGQEGSGAFVVGARYGEGQLFQKRGKGTKVYWQGPSIGFDAGAEGDRVMMLVYRLGNLNNFYERFGGVDGSAYIVGGFSISALIRDDMIVVPIRSGVGIRLGINVGYLKFTQTPTWNPF